jgi:hypothetical protein
LVAAHLPKTCVIKLALRDTFKAFQLWKEERKTLMSKTILQKHQEEKVRGLLIAKVTNIESPSRVKSTRPKVAANRVASNAAVASPKRTSEEYRCWVAAKIMDPEESEMVAAATEKELLIVTSKFPLKEPSKGGNQRE